MKRRWNGSKQSTNVPYFGAPGLSRSDFGMYRCMVTDVLYVDDTKNISKNSQNPEVLYQVVILGGSAAGQTLSNCRLAQYLNYSERILTPTSKDITKDKLSQHDGDVVWVQFNQGHDGYPTIIGLGKGLSDKSGAKKADGPRFIETYNGYIRNVNNKGELIETLTMGKVTEGKFVPNKEPMITLEKLSTEQINTTFKTGLKITQDGKNDVITQKFAGGMSATFDGKNDKAEIKTAGGATTTIDGKSSKVTIKVGATEVTIDGNSGKITLKGEMIDLGSSVSDFVTLFTQLATAFATHTHIGNMGAPTSPPMAPLLTSVGSQTVKVQP